MENTEQAAETPPAAAKDVLRRLLAEFPNEIDTIEFLEIRQATPLLYSVRVTSEYRGDRSGFLIDLRK